MQGTRQDPSPQGSGEEDVAGPAAVGEKPERGPRSSANRRVSWPVFGVRGAPAAVSVTTLAHCQTRLPATHSDT